MSDTMLAAVFEGPGKLEVKQVPVPRVEKSDDVKIKVKAASICGSDIHLLSIPPGQNGVPGTIMGHEFFGTVEETGPGAAWLNVGDTVVVNPVIPCGHCRECRTGHANLCLAADNVGQWSHGGFAQYNVTPAGYVYKIPADTPAVVAAQIEPVACVMNAMGKLNPTPNDRVVVFGAGAIGLIFIRLMKLYGVRDLLVCEMLDGRQRHAERCGAEWILNPAQSDLEKETMERWGAKPSIVVDAVGAGKVTEQALPLLGCNGRYLIFGQDNQARATISPALVVRNELTILGSYCTHDTFPAAIDLLGNPDLRVDLLVSHRMELKDIQKGMDVVASKEASRVIVYPNGMFDD